MKNNLTAILNAIIAEGETIRKNAMAAHVAATTIREKHLHERSVYYGNNLILVCESLKCFISEKTGNHFVLSNCLIHLNSVCANCHYFLDKFKKQRKYKKVWEYREYVRSAEYIARAIGKMANPHLENQSIEFISQYFVEVDLYDKSNIRDTFRINAAILFLDETQQLCINTNQPHNIYFNRDTGLLSRDSGEILVTSVSRFDDWDGRLLPQALQEMIIRVCEFEDLFIDTDSIHYFWESPDFLSNLGDELYNIYSISLDNPNMYARLYYNVETNVFYNDMIFEDDQEPINDNLVWIQSYSQYGCTPIEFNGTDDFVKFLRVSGVDISRACDMCEQDLIEEFPVQYAEYCEYYKISELDNFDPEDQVYMCLREFYERLYNYDKITTKQYRDLIKKLC